jgi:hypothetical protein
MLPGTVAGPDGRNLNQALPNWLWGYQSIIGYSIGVFSVVTNQPVAMGVIGIRNPGSGRQNYAHSLRRINGSSPINSARAMISERRQFADAAGNATNVIISFTYLRYGKQLMSVDGRGLEPNQLYSLAIKEYGDWNWQGNVFNPTLYANGSGSGGIPLTWALGAASSTGGISVSQREVSVNLNGWDSIIGRSAVLYETRRPVAVIGTAAIAIASFTEKFAPIVPTAAPNQRSSEPPPADNSWLEKRYKDSPGLTVFLAILGLLLCLGVLLLAVLCLWRMYRRKRATYSGDITAEVQRQKGGHRSQREIELERRLEREMIESRA